MSVAFATAGSARTATRGSASPHPLQRKCACGTAKSPLAEPCEACQSQALQAKLVVGPSDDPLEREADQIADQVTRAPDPASPDARDRPATAEKTLRAKSLPRPHASAGARGHVVPGIVHEVISAPGRPLDAATHQFAESHFGHDFGAIRIHTDTDAAAATNAVQARAYTVGQHIVFGEGEYRPDTLPGRRLLAHELAHALQQRDTAPTSRVLRRDRKPAKNTAAGGPQLDLEPATNTPPCGCLVFMHHNEPDARLMARLMHQFCRYNLAIVTPQTKLRTIDLPSKGAVDPNELFPRRIAEECWNDDTPCTEFLKTNAGATKGALVEEFAQRQFFLAIKHCSDEFSLPVVALHNNTIDDTAGYRKAVGRAKAPLDLTPVKGQTFDDTLDPATATTDTAPFSDLRDWLLTNVPGVTKKNAPQGAKGTITGGPIAPGKTNIFLWCAAEDISHCHIGDPERPDNVVWVTNRADFDRLQGTKTNVALQTRVDPAGRSATDLSSLFVFLEQIVGTRLTTLILKLEQDAAVAASEIAAAVDELERLREHGDVGPAGTLRRWLEIFVSRLRLVLRRLSLAAARGARAVRLSQLRYINIETPQTPYDPSATKPADLRVQSFRDVRTTLAAVGLDCCDAAPAQGETKSAAEKLESALRAGRIEP